MDKLLKVVIITVLCLLFVKVSFAAERVVVCEMIGNEG